MSRGKIHILHVGIDSHLGGIETYLLKIATYINKEKYQFDFLAFKGKDPCFRKELEGLGCQFYFIEQRKNNYFRYISDLKKLFLNNSFDIVHCHLNSLSCIEPCMFALKKGNKVIVHSRNAGNIVSLKSRVLHRINYYCLPKKKICCVAVSDYAGEWMFGKKVNFTVLNNGLDVEKYAYSEKSRKEIRKELEILDKQEVIIHIGAFRSQKNHDFIIEIFNEYLKIYPKTLLLLVGDGNLLSKIKDKVSCLHIQKNVRFLGNRKDIPELLSASDKFLFPSYYEGFPNALLEAETSGLYCVVSNTITTQAMLPDFCTSLSLEDSTSKWVEKLGENPINNRSCAKKIVENAELDISGEMRRLTELYNKLLCK